MIRFGDLPDNKELSGQEIVKSDIPLFNSSLSVEDA